MSQLEWETYLLCEEYQHDMVWEYITQISAKIFGRDHAGSNTYIHFCRQIRETEGNYGNSNLTCPASQVE